MWRNHHKSGDTDTRQQIIILSTVEIQQGYQQFVYSVDNLFSRSSDFTTTNMCQLVNNL